MNKFWRMLVENRLLLLLIAGVGIIIFLLLWECSVKGCLKMTISVNYANMKYWKDAERIGNNILVRGENVFVGNEIMPGDLC